MGSALSGYCFSLTIESIIIVLFGILYSLTTLQFEYLHTMYDISLNFLHVQDANVFQLSETVNHLFKYSFSIIIFFHAKVH